MKKKLGLILILFLIIASGVGYYIMWKTPPQTTTSPTPTAMTKIPTPTLSGIYPSLAMPTPIVSKSNYTINYVTTDQTYYITLLAAPYENNQDLAEQDLLKRLKLTQEQACGQVKVITAMPLYVLDTVQPIYNTFSFCSQ